MNVKTEHQFLNERLDQQSLKHEIGRALKQIFEDPDHIPLIFSDDYVQTTDGVTSNRAEFEDHVRQVASSVKNIDFEILDVVQQENLIADRHLVHVVYQDGRKATMEIYLFGTVTNGRLSRVHEISRIVTGDETLKAIAKLSAGQTL